MSKKLGVQAGLSDGGKLAVGPTLDLGVSGYPLTGDRAACKLLCALFFAIVVLLSKKLALPRQTDGEGRCFYFPAGNSYRPVSLAGGLQLTAGFEQLPHFANRLT